MSVLSELKPEKVFKFFEEICSIPHGSYETKAISDYLVKFAVDRSLEYRQEECNNVIIRKKPFPGYENSPAVIIQGHMDMVCEKESYCTKDMSKEGLDLFVDGDLIGARGTTLGGDDGIAVAIALAILDSPELPHGPLECIFTVDEEVGMTGAHSINASDIKGRYLLNLDSEVEKVFTVSCAGSIRALNIFPIKREAFDGEIFEISVGGLIGGHSGEEIHMGRANANIIMGRALTELSEKIDVRILSVKGGAKDNAIPRESTAIVAVSDGKTAEKVISDLTAALRTEYYTPDGGVYVKIAPTKSDIVPFDADTTKRVSCFMFCVPNGIQNMSADVPGLVQTSLNLGRVFIENETVVFSHMLRSSVNSQNWEVESKISMLCRSLGGRPEVTTSYSAWEYQPESHLRDVMIEAFKYVYGELPTVAALHAGLECGILSGKMPGLDCVSYGPDITDIHTPRERLHIGSIRRTWDLTLEILKRLK